jgi:hypothetical protein
MPDFSRMTDAELREWATNFQQVVGASPTDYGVTAGLITDFSTANAGLGTKMTERVSAEEARKAAVAAQKEASSNLESLCSYLNTTIKANPDVSDVDKIAAGIDVGETPTHTAPVTPTGLVVNGFENGTNILKWNRAGNKPSTQFIVEYREGTETEFEFLCATTKTTCEHKGVTPGMQCVYRIKAQRAGEESPYSNTAVVYMP